MARLAGQFTGGPAAADLTPPADAIRRWSAVPLLEARESAAELTRGRVVFDAWSDGGVALRDATVGHARRLTLAAGRVALDLVAWRDETGWRFTARVRSEDRVSHDFVLRTGRQRLLPGAGGYFQWRSRGVPRVLELWSFDARIQFEPIAWT